jgi:hypothetical protein
MAQADKSVLRRQAEQAYARWRACEAQMPRDAAASEECARLRAEYEVADRAYLQARTGSPPDGRPDA